MFTTGLPAGFRVEREAAFDLRFVRMALVAALAQQRQHLGLKECRSVLRFGGSDKQQSCEEAFHHEKTV
jgi:hypothetical protein